MDKTGTSKVTSFRQFEYCYLCKCSHKKRKKHIYSNRHQEILSKILDKFSKKVVEARETLRKPTLRELSFEKGAKFWCYFCAEEVVKHQEMGLITLQFGGLIEHIASPEHSKKTDDFFWKNILEKKLKEKFLISEESLKLYKISAELAAQLFTERQEEQTKKSGQLVQQQDIHRQRFYQWQLRKSMSEVKPIRNLAPVEESSKARFVGKRTVIANGPGLACLQSQDGDKGEGNIFSDATPPWLRGEDESKTGVKDVGPTIQDYKNHLAREKKKKLPPNRVGANFNRTEPLSSQWLPSFGRVWSKGRRLQSKIFFEKESRKSGNFIHQTTNKSHVLREDEDKMIPYKKQRHEQDAIASYSGHNAASVTNIVPYKRKEKTETVTRPTDQHFQHMIATPLLFSNRKCNDSFTRSNQPTIDCSRSTSEKIMSYNDSHSLAEMLTVTGFSKTQNQKEHVLSSTSNCSMNFYSSAQKKSDSTD